MYLPDQPAMSTNANSFEYSKTAISPLDWSQTTAKVAAVGGGDVGKADPDETSQDGHRPCKVRHRVGSNTSVVSAHALSNTGIVLTSVPSECQRLSEPNAYLDMLLTTVRLLAQKAGCEP